MDQITGGNLSRETGWEAHRTTNKGVFFIRIKDVTSRLLQGTGVTIKTITKEEGSSVGWFSRKNAFLDN